jgi:DNA-directed RNA polymerase subunit RPC12/RpoP
LALRTYLRRWRRPPSASSVVVPYEVTCACGQAVRGLRKRRHQVVRCPGCGAAVFVLPRSPWPPVEDGARPAAAAGAAPAVARSPWLMPAVAGAVSLAVLLVLFLLALPLLSRRAPTEQAQMASQDQRLAAAMAAGERALADSNYRLALREFNAAVDLRDRNPGLLAPAQDRWLTRLQRQSDLLARLLNRSLQEVVQEAALVRDPDEWQARFDDDYRGRTVIFDDTVGRDADGRPALSTYAVVVNKETVRLALEDLKLLQALPLQPPARMLFGARLAGCAREEGGGWVIRFEADSGVLLTDPGAAASCCPAPPGRELDEVLHRQGEWLDDLAGRRPARE